VPRLSWGSLDLDKATLAVTRTLVDLDGDQPVWNQPVWSDANDGFAGSQKGDL
jgi:hypothetical protein